MTDIPDIRVEPWEDGSAFSVKAHPGAKREGFAGSHDGMLKIEVTAAPEKGKANRAIAKFLAKSLGVAPARLVLLSGETGSRKRFGIQGLKPEPALRKLSEILG